MSDGSSTSTSAPKPNTFTVVSGDGHSFELDMKLAEQSETLSKLIENFDYSQDDVRKMPVPLCNLKKEQVEKIILWLERHRNHSAWVPRDKQYVPDYKFGEWSTNYFNIPNNELFELIVAANYLCIPRLYDAVGRQIASKIAGKSAEEMIKVFNLKGTPIKPRMAKTTNQQSSSSHGYGTNESEETPEKRFKTK
ncbi:unnamed protein product [Caenorhabditis brenneri]